MVARRLLPVQAIAMPSFATLMNVLLGYGSKAEDRSGPRYRQPSDTLHYGKHPLQALDLHLHPDGGTRPLLAFMHGGAWQFGDKTRRHKDVKVPFAHAEGWHFASINTRLVPQVGVDEMARNLAEAVGTLFQRGEDHGIDTRRIVLMGHSSGAHLSALVATDPALLGRYGIAPTDLAGVILNDGAAFHAGEPSTHNSFWQRRLLDPAFAEADLDALSPVLHAQRGGRFPPTLLLHGGTSALTRQAELLEAALRDAGSAVERHAFPGRSIIAHMYLSRHFGRDGSAATAAALAWLQDKFEM